MLIDTVSIISAGSVRVDGTIDGPCVALMTADLIIDAGGTVTLTGEVGGAGDLNSVQILSSGKSYLTVPITVLNSFEWCVPGGTLIVIGQVTATELGGTVTLGANNLIVITGPIADNIFLMCFVP